MDQSYFIKAKLRWLLLQFLLVSVVQYEARSVHCPSTCACENDIVKFNTANCTIGNSTVDIKWFDMGDGVLLQLNCVDEVENYQHDCNNLPQFDISINKTLLEVEGCAPSIYRCAQKMFTPVTTIVYFKVTIMAGSLTADDLTNLDHASEVEMFLKRGTVMQAVDLNALKSIEMFTMDGGNLQLSSNVLKLPKLQILNLVQNNIRNLPPNAFNGLPKLRYLKIASNTFEHLDVEHLKGLDSLADIRFVNNSLVTIEPAAFSATKQLGTLHVMENRLKLVPNGLFAGLDKLFQVIIKKNQVEMALDTHAFANLPSSVRIVEVSVCNVKYLPENVFNGSANINQLNLHGNQIESLLPNIFTTTTGLLGLNLRGNKLQNIPDGIFSKLKELQYIDLSYNHLSELRGDIFTYNTKLKIVKINDNRLTNIDRDTFKGMNLMTLDLTSNKLQRIVGDGPLEWQTKKLYLNNNELSVFEEWFSELVGVNQLNLSGNKIKMIKATEIYKFKGKAIIDIRNNNISEIVPDTSVPRINATASDVTIRLSNNPIQCDGIVTTLLKEWHERGILLDYEDITCDNGLKLSQSYRN